MWFIHVQKRKTHDQLSLAQNCNCTFILNWIAWSWSGSVLSNVFLEISLIHSVSQNSVLQQMCWLYFQIAFLYLVTKMSNRSMPYTFRQDLRRKHWPLGNANWQLIRHWGLGRKQKSTNSWPKGAEVPRKVRQTLN